VDPLGITEYNPQPEWIILLNKICLLVHLLPQFHQVYRQILFPQNVPVLDLQYDSGSDRLWWIVPVYHLVFYG